MVALDIPLLYEVAADELCNDHDRGVRTLFVQSGRVLASTNMTQEKLNDILRQQMADLKKRRRATFVIPSGFGRRTTLQTLIADRQTHTVKAG